MTTVIVDTCVLSYVFKDHEIAQKYSSHLINKVLVLSFMTIAELERWALEHNWSKSRKQMMDDYLKNYIIYPFDHTLCSIWAEITLDTKRQGKPVSCADAWIAACAIRHDIPLVTHNAKDYRYIKNLKIITEYEE